jgi:hypothetical protein
LFLRCSNPAAWAPACTGMHLEAADVDVVDVDVGPSNAKNIQSHSSFAVWNFLVRRLTRWLGRCGERSSRVVTDRQSSKCPCVLCTLVRSAHDTVGPAPVMGVRGRLTALLVRVKCGGQTARTLPRTPNSSPLSTLC